MVGWLFGLVAGWLYVLVAGWPGGWMSSGLLTGLDAGCLAWRLACFADGLVVGCLVFVQAVDGIRYFCLSRGLGDVYNRQVRSMIVF